MRWSASGRSIKRDAPRRERSPRHLPRIYDRVLSEASSHAYLLSNWQWTFGICPSPLTAMATEVFNPNPTIFATTKAKKSAHAFAKPHSLWLDDAELRGDGDDEYDQSDEPEAIDQDEIFGACPVFYRGMQPVQILFCAELIRSISDPEHRSMSLEQLAVVSAPQITFEPSHPDRLTVEFTPTVPHCGMSTFIGTLLSPVARAPLFAQVPPS